eukprot:9592-Heterococcus_DN1.PRE.1
MQILKQLIRRHAYTCLSSADHAAVDFVHAQVPRDMKMRVLVAAGGGDAALSLLTNPHVATVASVSSSGAQHHLTTLKLALALSDLPTEAIIKALGMELSADPVNPDAAAHRAELFSTSVLPALSKLNPSSAAFWQDRIAREVAFAASYARSPHLRTVEIVRYAMCGRDQRWRALRLVALEKLDIHARDLLSRDAASAHSALQSLECVDEALRNAVPADHVATIMGWTTTSTSSTAGTD